MNKSKKMTHLVWFLISAFVIGVSIYITPYAIDDWAWGSQVGLDRLDTMFKGYNGRYFGNFIIIAIARSNILKTLSMTAVIVTIPLIIKKICKQDSILYYFIPLVLLYAMPSQLYAQTLGWASGFSNYIAPTVLLVFNFYMFNGIFTNEGPSYHKIFPLVAVIVGISNALFMENVTLFNVVLGATAIVFCLVKFKKVYATHIAFLVGAIIGAVIMFSNSAYGIIASGNDYRAMGKGLSGIIAMARENLRVMYIHLIENNLVLNLVSASVLLILVVIALKNDENSKQKKAIIFGLEMINLSYVIFTVFLAKFTKWTILVSSYEATERVKILFAIAFYATLVVLPFLCIKDWNVKLRIVATALSMGVVTVPLFIVQPVSARCFFVQYVLYVLYFCEILVFIVPKYSKAKETLITAVSACVIALIIYYLPIIYGLKAFNDYRVDYMNKEIQEGKQQVYIIRYPKELNDYILFGTPSNNTMWEERYKAFYHIDEEIDLVPINYEEFQKLKKD